MRARLLLLIGDGSQKEFADFLKIAPAHINAYLQGKAKPGFDILLRFAEGGINVNWFLTGAGPIYQQDQSKPYPLTAGQQMLIRETPPELITAITEIVRSLKQTEDLKQNLELHKEKARTQYRNLKKRKGKTE